MTRYAHGVGVRQLQMSSLNLCAGAEVTDCKVASWVPPPDPARLHLSQVPLLLLMHETANLLDWGALTNARASVCVIFVCCRCLSSFLQQHILLSLASLLLDVMYAACFHSQFLSGPVPSPQSTCRPLTDLV